MMGPRGIPGHHLVKSAVYAILYLLQFPQPVVASGICPLGIQAFEKKMQTRSTTEEYVELAETCLAESRRTLDRRVSEQLRIMARRYLQEAERLDEVKRLSQGSSPGAQP
jgi:Lon protease-like protein